MNQLALQMALLLEVLGARLPSCYPILTSSPRLSQPQGRAHRQQCFPISAVVAWTVLKGPPSNPWLGGSSKRPPHLAGLVVHVEGGDDTIRQLPSLPQHQVLGQPVGQVGFPGAAGAGEDDPPVLHQQGHIALQDGLGDQGLEHQ